MEDFFPVGQIVAELRESLKELTNGTDAGANLLSFFHSIDWKVEPLLEAVIVGRTDSRKLLYFGRWLKVQGVLFVAIAVCIYEGEALNALCAKHWTNLATQPYFDKSGIFWSTLVSGPLLVILLCILVPCPVIGVSVGWLALQVNCLLEMMRLMVKVKKKQLMVQAQKIRENKKDS